MSDWAEYEKYIVPYLEGTLSAEDKATFEQAVDTYPKLAKEVGLIFSVKKYAEFEKEKQAFKPISDAVFDELEEEGFFDNLENELEKDEKETPSRGRLKLWLLALGLLLICALGIWYKTNENSNKQLSDGEAEKRALISLFQDKICPKTKSMQEGKQKNLCDNFTGLSDEAFEQSAVELESATQNLDSTFMANQLAKGIAILFQGNRNEEAIAIFKSWVNKSETKPRQLCLPAQCLYLAYRMSGKQDEAKEMETVIQQTVDCPTP